MVASEVFKSECMHAAVGLILGSGSAPVRKQEHERRKREKERDLWLSDHVAVSTRRERARESRPRTTVHH